MRTVLYGLKLLSFTVASFHAVLGSLHSIEHFKTSFLTTFQRFQPQCNASKVNLVLPRHDVHNKQLPPIRQWSVNDRTYWPVKGQGICLTLEQLTRSVRNGNRQYKPSRRNFDFKSKHFLTDNRTDTFFVPHGCNYKWFSSTELCEVSNRFAFMYLFGNSMLRHLTQGMLMLLSDDWMRGALPGFPASGLIFKKCVCDGQFSENLVCRPYSDRDGLVVKTITSLRHLNKTLCPSLPVRRVSFGLKYNGFDSFDGPCLNVQDRRPRLVYIQGGVKWELKQTEFLKHIDKILQGVEEHKQRCGVQDVPFFFVFSGLTAQASYLDNVYPLQTKAVTLPFSQLIYDHVRGALGDNATILDFYQLTENAASSDGYHSMTDVNMVEAMYLFNAMDLMTKSSSY